jgi:hypothetical protein
MNRLSALLLTAALVGIASMSWAAEPPKSGTAPSAAASTVKASPAVGPAASSPASTSPTQAQQTLPGRTFAPVYLPREVTFTEDQLKEIRAAVADQVKAFHDSLAKQNKAAADKHAIWLKDYQSTLADEDWKRLYNQSIFSDQRSYSKYIFWIVIVILAVALGLTIHQFVRDANWADKATALLLADKLVAGAATASGSTDAADRPASPATPPSGGSSPVHEPPATVDPVALALLRLWRGNHTVNLGPGGVQLGSQFVGLVIMAFALWFFYFYIEKVYPITIAKEPPALAASAPPP